MLREIGVTGDESVATPAASDMTHRPARRLPGHAAKRVWLLSRLAGGEANKQAALEDWSFYEAELVAELIEAHPELLTGPWAILLALVQNDAQLWVHPGPTGSDAPATAESGRRFIDVDVLHERLADLKWRSWASL
jgi:hypothetical protein